MSKHQVFSNCLFQEPCLEQLEFIYLNCVGCFSSFFMETLVERRLICFKSFLLSFNVFVGTFSVRYFVDSGILVHIVEMIAAVFI